MRRRQDLSNKMRCRSDFLTKSSWVLCPVNAIRKLFSTNLSSESSCFNQCINRLINLWPAYSTYVFPTGPACGIVSLLGTCIAECCSVFTEFPRITAQNLLLSINGLINELTFGRPIVRLFSPLLKGDLLGDLLGPVSL